MIVAPLEQTFALELDEVVLAGAQQQSDQLVVNVCVNLREKEEKEEEKTKRALELEANKTHGTLEGVSSERRDTYIKQFAEVDHLDVGVLLRHGLAVNVDHLAEFEHFLVHLDVGLLASVLS